MRCKQWSPHDTSPARPLDRPWSQVARHIKGAGGHQVTAHVTLDLPPGGGVEVPRGGAGADTADNGLHVSLFYGLNLIKDGECCEG